MRIDALDDLAVELQHEAQYAVRSRMLRPEVDGEIAQAGLIVHRLALGLILRGAERGEHFGASHGLRLVGKVVIGGFSSMKIWLVNVKSPRSSKASAETTS